MRERVQGLDFADLRSAVEAKPWISEFVLQQCVDCHPDSTDESLRHLVAGCVAHLSFRRSRAIEWLVKRGKIGLLEHVPPATVKTTPRLFHLALLSGSLEMARLFFVPGIGPAEDSDLPELRVSIAMLEEFQNFFGSIDGRGELWLTGTTLKR